MPALCHVRRYAIMSRPPWRTLRQTTYGRQYSQCTTCQLITQRKLSSSRTTSGNKRDITFLLPGVLKSRILNITKHNWILVLQQDLPVGEGFLCECQSRLTSKRLGHSSIFITEEMFSRTSLKLHTNKNVIIRIRW